ncbi:hypothetical protein ACFV9C_28130 [Kribbella sp. NPDC059898]|uniref:hypothetical protein n=1 Tax=Kribbella sp. NPDC059898 TaxID=3346995 RepID=UPI0036639D93
MAFEIKFPEYLEGYEFATESKGYLVDVVIRSGTRMCRLTIYDPGRLQQEIADEIHAAGSLALSNVLIVEKVTREYVIDALSERVESEFCWQDA